MQNGVKPLTTLTLPESFRNARFASTSVPWPAERDDAPIACGGQPCQSIPLFEPHLRPRRRRFLVLMHAAAGLPGSVTLAGGALAANDAPFSDVRIHIRKACYQKGCYVHEECDAILKAAGRELTLRLGLLPNNATSREAVDAYAWWQWCRAERIWSGPLAEAWRLGGHLPCYPIGSQDGKLARGLAHMGDSILDACGDVLQAELYLIIWKGGLIQATAHFKSTYFHNFPKPIPAYPVLYLAGLNIPNSAVTVTRDNPGAGACGKDRLDFSPGSLMFTAEFPGELRPLDSGILFQPWSDLRILANKTKENDILYLEPGTPDVMPAGIARSCFFNIGLDGADTRVARYQVAPAWRRVCGELATERPGLAAAMAERSAVMIREHTHKGGIDTGFVWRYMRRDLRSGKPQEDAAEWEGNLAQAMFTLAYQRADCSPEEWQLYLHHAYHAADVAVYHGAWMGRLEGSPAMTGPLPKFRFGGMLFGYLETGDPYLLEMCRAMAGVYMAMEQDLQPRRAMGRDAYPLSNLMALWDYCAEPHYLDFARQTAIRLLATQCPDGGFSGQAGAGIFAGRSSVQVKNSMGFGNLAAIGLLEWAIRDQRRPPDFPEKLRKWVEMILRLQTADGLWLQNGDKGDPYPLNGAIMLFALVKAGELLNDPRCLRAIRAFLRKMDALKDHVTGTHAFLQALYAHVADAALENLPDNDGPQPAASSNQKTTQGGI